MQCCLKYYLHFWDSLCNKCANKMKFLQPVPSSNYKVWKLAAYVWLDGNDDDDYNHCSLIF